MNILALPLGAYQTNCYLVWNHSDCIIIDPGCDDALLTAALQREHLQPRAVLLTHGHFDHVGGVAAWLEREVSVYLHPLELSLPQPLCPLDRTKSYHFLSDGDRLSFGTLSFQVLHTPGHTPGSCCFRLHTNLFSGDTLFAGSCGRVDLGGSAEQMRASLHLLSQIPEDLTVFPGHGPSTTLLRENRQNPYWGGGVP